MGQQSIKPRKIPTRQCLGCNEHKPKKELLRVLRTPEGEITLDFTGKKSGISVSRLLSIRFDFLAFFKHLTS